MAEFITPLQLAARYGHFYVCKYLYDNMYCFCSISLQMTLIPLAIHIKRARILKKSTGDPCFKRISLL